MTPPPPKNSSLAKALNCSDLLVSDWMTLRSSVKLSSELAHARREQHQLEGEARLVQPAKEQLASVEQRNQQLSVQLAQAMEQSASLVQENQDIAGRLQNAQVTVRELETELVAVNARLGVHEQILQGLKLAQAVDVDRATGIDNSTA